MRQSFLVLLALGLILSPKPEAWPQSSDHVAVDLNLDFKVEELEKEPYSINADIEIEEVITFFDQDALLYKQKYLDKKRNTAFQTDVNLTIEGQYQKESITLYGRFNGLFSYNEDVNFESEKKAEEVYLSYQPSYSLALEAGKKVHKWGKGYAFSPTAFFSRPKDLNDPDASLEGYYTLSFDYIKSMTGILRTFTATPVLMPVTNDINTELGTMEEWIWGGKFYFFAFDTDMDLMFLMSDNLNDRLGLDFSKNLSPSFEIHGDAALIKDHRQYVMDENWKISEQEFTAFNFLVGLRYLSNDETTYILEYYRNEQGYSSDEYDAYLTFIEKGYEQYLSTSSKESITKSKSHLHYYSQQAAMQNYLYLKISKKEPFDILYLVPGISFIYNLDDSSGSISPQLTYTPLTNLVLDLKLKLLFGSSKTEYGEKAGNAKLSFFLQYYF
jgi:hypothetical protein